MAWTTPMVATEGDVLTASEYNLYIRDNLMEMAAHKARLPGSVWVSEGSNRVRELRPATDTVTIQHSLAARFTAYRDVQSAGPMVSLQTQSTAIVTISAEMMNTGLRSQASASFEVTGATTINPSDLRRICHDGAPAERWTRQSATCKVALNPGNHMFRMRYRSGGGGDVYFRRRSITVLPL